MKCCRKKFWVSFQRIIELFTQKFVTTVSKIGVWDPRSGIRKKTYSGSGSRDKKAPDPGSGSATLMLSIRETNITLQICLERRMGCKEERLKIGERERETRNGDVRLGTEDRKQGTEK